MTWIYCITRLYVEAAAAAEQKTIDAVEALEVGRRSLNPG
jgi:hypothetical protein